MLGERFVELVEERSRLVGIVERRDSHDGVGVVDAHRLHVEVLDLLAGVHVRRAVQDVVVPLELEPVGGVDAGDADSPELVGVADHVHHRGAYCPSSTT